VSIINLKEMKNKERRLITAALPYVNNVPHAGNIVGSHLPADIFARYCRLKGYETLFIGGTDEHGTPIILEAEKAGISEKELCDHFYKIHKQVYDWLNISYDNFSRTSNQIHHQTTQDFFKKIYKKGWIIEKEMLLPFCRGCKRYLADRYIEGTCPFCGCNRARGDQCEACGRVLDPIELRAPRCAICQSDDIEFRKTRHLFLNLTKFSSKLEKWINSNHLWRSQVKALALGWIKEGLKPRSITRDLEWGVKVPLKGYEDKVFYVWFEAPIGYISSTKEILKDDWQKYWQDPDCKIYHFVGKDNISFHAIFWPASLMAHGGFNLPHNVVGLQYLNFEGKKISKSKKWGVFCGNLKESGIESDYWRFYLSHLIPETSDSNFKWSEFQDRINNDLVANFSNLVYRTSSIVYSSLSAKAARPDVRDLSLLDKRLIEAIEKKTLSVGDLIERVELRKALKEIFSLASEANKYFDYNSPWKLVKEDKKKAEKVLYLCLDVSKTLAVLISPYLPESAEKIFKQLGLNGKANKRGTWDLAGKWGSEPFFKIKKPKMLFTKIEKEQIEKAKLISSKID